jgi:hypothetical protein
MTTDAQQAEFDRIHGYLSSQGERYDCAGLWRRIVPARLELLDALDGVTDAQADFKPSPDAWSIREVAQHILKSSRGTRGLVQRLAAGQGPGEGDDRVFETPRETTDAPIEALRDELLRDGLAWAAATEQLPPRPPLEPTAPHMMFGPLHARAWYLFERVHDVDHANQIKAVKAAPGYPA